MTETVLLSRLSIERGFCVKNKSYFSLILRITEDYNPGAFVGPKGMTQKQYFYSFGARNARFYLFIFCT